MAKEIASVGLVAKVVVLGISASVVLTATNVQVVQIDDHNVFPVVVEATTVDKLDPIGSPAFEDEEIQAKDVIL